MLYACLQIIIVQCFMCSPFTTDACRRRYRDSTQTYSFRVENEQVMRACLAHFVGFVIYMFALPARLPLAQWPSSLLGSAARLYVEDYYARFLFRGFHYSQALFLNQSRGSSLTFLAFLVFIRPLDICPIANGMTSMLEQAQNVHTSGSCP